MKLGGGKGELLVIEWLDCITFLDDPRGFGYGVCTGLGLLRVNRKPGTIMKGIELRE